MWTGMNFSAMFNWASKSVMNYNIIVPCIKGHECDNKKTSTFRCMIMLSS